MTPQTIALYATDTMPDWEYAYLTTQIRRAEEARPGRFHLVLVGDGLSEVTSLGSMPVRPTWDLADLADDPTLAALVLPGADTYATGHDRVGEVAERLLQRGTPVAAICGSTYLLARCGLLDGRRHTSNDPAFLAASGYRGGQLYTDAPVVTDGGLTTAGGVNAIAFTAEVTRRTGLCPSELTDAWEQLYLTGESQHYFRLMELVGAWQNA